MKSAALALALVGMTACGDGGLGAAGDSGMGAATDASGCESPIDMATDGVCTAYAPAGLPCDGMDWYVGGELQQTGSYDVVCGAGVWVSRTDATCAAIAAGASAIACVR